MRQHTKERGKKIIEEKHKLIKIEKRAFLGFLGNDFSLNFYLARKNHKKTYKKKNDFEKRKILFVAFFSFLRQKKIKFS